MSSLLKEAIVDAKALKEAALKNAESTIIDKYSDEVKEMVENILEQEEAPLGDLGDQDDLTVAEDADVEVTTTEIPLASTNDLSDQEGVGLDEAPSNSEEIEFNIDLKALEEAVSSLENELNEDEDLDAELNEEEHDDDKELDEELELSEETIASLLEDEELEETYYPGYDTEEEQRKIDRRKGRLGRRADGTPIEPGDPEDPNVRAKKTQTNEEEEIEEELDADALVDAIMEKLTVDMGADLAGWAGRSSEDQVHQMEKEMAHRRSTDVEEELDALKSAQEDLVFENNNLNEKLEDYTNVIENLRENLQDVNLSNARLLYTNRVLRNTSLNERQKETIVEAISSAGSVTEAKTIFETLQSTVEAKPKQRPQSLSEAIGNKRTSVIRATRQERTTSDPLSERMKRLAGIK